MLVTSKRQFKAILLKFSDQLNPEACMEGPVEAEFGPSAAGGSGFLGLFIIQKRVTFVHNAHNLTCLRNPLPSAPEGPISDSTGPTTPIMHASGFRF